MITYQDLLIVGEDEKDRMDFVRSAINSYQATDFYKTAKIADEYDRRKNPDIAKYTKMLYTVTGRQIPDQYSSNYRIGRAFFPFFITQEVQYLLGNGVNWQEETTADRLGTKKAPFDTRLQACARAGLSGGCAYGFWNLDHVEVFKAPEFVPLLDEENGALRAGIRYWQIDASKPFRATLYEEDGCTDYIWKKCKTDGTVRELAEVLHEKRPYKNKTVSVLVDGEVIFHGENYPSFPIVPLWGNKHHQSEIVGLREQIFAYDMIRSGFCDTVQDASYIFWAIHNAPGMDDIALAEFMQRVKRLHIAVTEDAGSTAEPQQIETPYQSRVALLEMLEKDIFKDAMAFDPEQVASGAATATQIRAAYDNLELKVNDFEYCVLEFISGIMELAGVEDVPTFTRSRSVNVQEEITAVMSAATALDQEYTTKKILTILGDGDQAEEVMRRMVENEVTRQRELPGEDGDVNAE